MAKHSKEANQLFDDRVYIIVRKFKRDLTSTAIAHQLDNWYSNGVDPGRVIHSLIRLKKRGLVQIENPDDNRRKTFCLAETETSNV
jgi:hypothetical protein